MDLVYGSNRRESCDRFKTLIRIKDAFLMLRPQEALSLLPSDFLDRVDEEHLSPALRGLRGATYDNARFHRRVVEEIRAEPEHALEEVQFDEPAAKLSLLVSEENPM